MLADSNGVVLPHTDLSAALEEKDRQVSCLPQKLPGAWQFKSPGAMLFGFMWLESKNRHATESAPLFCFHAMHTIKHVATQRDERLWGINRREMRQHTGARDFAGGQAANREQPRAVSPDLTRCNTKKGVSSHVL